MKTFVNILILLAFTITMLSFLDKNTYEPFSGFMGNVKSTYYKNKRNARRYINEKNSSVTSSVNRMIRKVGL
jgi:hypothetical protein